MLQERFSLVLLLLLSMTFCDITKSSINLQVNSKDLITVFSYFVHARLWHLLLGGAASGGCYGRVIGNLLSTMPRWPLKLPLLSLTSTSRSSSNSSQPNRIHLITVCKIVCCVRLSLFYFPLYSDPASSVCWRVLLIYWSYTIVNLLLHCNYKASLFLPWQTALLTMRCCGDSATPLATNAAFMQ